MERQWRMTCLWGGELVQIQNAVYTSAPFGEYSGWRRSAYLSKTEKFRQYRKYNKEEVKWQPLLIVYGKMLYKFYVMRHTKNIIESIWSGLKNMGLHLREKKF